MSETPFGKVPPADPKLLEVLKPRELSNEATTKQVIPHGKGADITTLVKKEIFERDFIVPKSMDEALGMISGCAVYVKYRIMNPLAEFPVKPEGTNELAHAIIRDFEARAAMGEKKYGERLHASNGRKASVDLLQELYDAWLYCRQHLEDKS